jgi:hypothetical protein
MVVAGFFILSTKEYEELSTNATASLLFSRINITHYIQAILIHPLKITFSSYMVSISRMAILPDIPYCYYNNQEIKNPIISCACFLLDSFIYNNVNALGS